MVSDKWKSLMAKSEKITIDGQEMTIYGLNFTELGDLSKFHNAKDNVGAMEFLLKRTLRKAPEVADEDVEPMIEGIGIDKATEIVQAVQRLSGISEEEPGKKE